MTEDEKRRASLVWNNGKIPVILRRERNPVRLRVLYSVDSKEWLRGGSRNKEPKWDQKRKYWELPASRFNDLVKMLLSRYGTLYIIQPYREKEVCAPACMNAGGFECQCSCMGRNHGASQNGGWFEVSDAFAVRYGEKRLACRLIHSSTNIQEKAQPSLNNS